MGGRAIPRCTSCGYKYHNPPAVGCTKPGWHSKDGVATVPEKARRDYAKSCSVCISVTVTGEQAAALFLQAQDRALSLGGMVATVITQHLEKP